MASYNFKCESCSSLKELVVPVDERDEPQHCANCGKRMVRKLSIPALSFSGMGFTRGYVKGGS